ncbi:hypothetical protein ACET3Z_021672 [Daucus carota]
MMNSLLSWVVWENNQFSLDLEACKCICKKFSDEELERCPVCDNDLSVVPEEKLRSDHNLEDLRAKIFPYKRRKPDPSEDVPSIKSYSLHWWPTVLDFRQRLH